MKIDLKALTKKSEEDFVATFKKKAEVYLTLTHNQNKITVKNIKASEKRMEDTIKALEPIETFDDIQEFIKTNIGMSINNTMLPR